MRGGELGAFIPPYVAAQLLRRTPAEQLAALAAAARTAGREDLARDIDFGAAQLKAAALAYRRSLTDAAVSASRNTETVRAASAAESSAMDEISTHEAATRLGCSQRRVLQHLGKGTLRGMKRGRDWAVDRVSVDELADFRRSA